MNKLTRLVSIALCLALIAMLPVRADASDAVFLIDEPKDLLALSEKCRLDAFSTNITVVLSNNIDMTGFDLVPIPIFSGSFHGNGHTISGLTLTPTGSVQGLFRTLTDTAIVTDLHLEAEVTPGGSASITGGLAGINYGIIRGCSFNGTVSGIDRIGGIVGTNGLTGIIENCDVNGSVHGTHFIGGIAGENAGVIRHCENNAQVNTTVEQNKVELGDITLESVTGTEYAATVTDVGGICGTGSGVIRQCHNYGNVGYPQIGYNIGGIAGSFSGYIEGCSNSAEICGRKEVAGILGQLEPAVNILYEEDTIQTLQNQLDGLSATAGSAGGRVQSGANALDRFSNDLETQIEDAQEALKLLIPDPENPSLPDEDTLEAARNALSSSLSDMTGSLNTMIQSGMDTLSGLTGDLQSITGQMNQIGATVGSAADNLGGSVSDISDLDTEDDRTAKVESCRNLGSIQGEWNVGGIVGAMAPENDLDPESDLQLIGNNSLNFDIELRAVVLDCENAGTVYASKQNAGGIAGWVSMGLIKNSINTAGIEAENADYVGGIAGQSMGFLRDCNAKCAILGSTYVGGISGTGATVTDCLAMVTFYGHREKFGAILGVMEGAVPVGNYYLPIGSDPGAIDGISYAALAEPLSEEAFFAREDLPGQFRLVRITFLFDDGTVQTHSLPYGCAIGAITFPEIPKKGNIEGHWEGPDMPSGKVRQDVTFTVVYPSHVTVLSSQLTDHNGRPVMLLQGEFTKDATLSAEVLSETEFDYCWSFSHSQSLSSMTMRVLIPEGLSGDMVAAKLRLADGSWQTAQFRTDGSYLVISLPDGADALGISAVAQDYTLLILIAAGGLLIAAAAVTGIAISKKRKKAK